VSSATYNPWSERRADKIAEALEQLIFDGTFADGDRLDEVQLAERFKCLAHADPRGVSTACAFGHGRGDPPARVSSCASRARSN
jgi:hypothetical protein